MRYRPYDAPNFTQMTKSTENLEMDLLHDELVKSGELNGFCSWCRLDFADVIERPRRGVCASRNQISMLYGLYLSAQGAQNQSLRLQTISNNVANSDTTGFKRDLAVFQDHLPFDLQQGNITHPPGDLNQSTGGTTLASTYTDFAEGPHIKTGAAYDVAIAGKGFLQVKQGSETYLTRNGKLAVNDLGELVTQDQGLPVLNTSGSSVVIPPSAKDVNIGQDGTLTATAPDGGVITLGQLNLVQPANLENLQKLGGSLYRSSGPLAPVDNRVQIRQGYLEASGVKPIAETVNMIEASKAFETNINMIKFQDDTLSRLLQSMMRN